MLNTLLLTLKLWNCSYAYCYERYYTRRIIVRKLLRSCIL